MVMLREEMGKEGALLKRGAPFLWGGKAAHTLKLPTGTEGDHVHLKFASLACRWQANLGRTSELDL